VDIRAGVRSDRGAEDDEFQSFDPREIAAGAVAREFAAHLDQAAAPAAGGARTGLARLAAGDYPAAAAAFETVLKADPASAPAAFLLGWAFHGAGEDRRAISAWRRAVYLQPSLVPAHLALIDLFQHLSQPDLALQAARAGLEALPRSSELLDRLARLERK
jgi:tetratricopeptide (TPR) repeat protein